MPPRAPASGRGGGDEQRERWRARRRKAWAVIVNTSAVFLWIVFAIGLIAPWVEWLTGLSW
ncbi:MAG: hypothetical protein OXI46_05900 [Gemmatimonadota bacterium]|nr:hypothetical protein [Gemmatimonadota bacterium]